MHEKSENSEEEFAKLMNLVMAKGIQNDADPDTMARICLNTARELFLHYGAGDDHTDYLTYITDTQFQMAEIEQWLDETEGKPWTDED